MACSPARHLANQNNAAKSTGPRTPEGKLASRRNSLKHGLTGEGVVVRDEDSGEIAERAEVLQGELAPGGGLMTQILVKRVAAMSIRAERCVRHETSMIAERVRTAPEDFDEARHALAHRLFDEIALDPATSHRRLLAMPEGVDLLLNTMGKLRSDLTLRSPIAWTEAHAKTFDHGIGRRLDAIGASTASTLTEAILGRFDRFDPSTVAEVAPEARSEWASDRMLELIEEEIARLKAHREYLDLEAIEISRSEAAQRVLFDPGHEATLARKYEAAAERAMYKALKELREVQAQEKAKAEARRPEAHRKPQPVAPKPPLGSFLSGAELIGYPESWADPSNISCQSGGQYREDSSSSPNRTE